MSVFDEFDAQYESETLAKQVKDQEENGSNGNYEELPTGNYEVVLDNLECKKTKETKRPMVSFWWKVIAGDKKGKLIFQNQVISEKAPDTCINITNGYLKALETGVDVKFESFKQWENMILDVYERTAGKDYQLDYTNSEDGEKGFAKYKIVKVLSDKGDGVPF